MTSRTLLAALLVTCPPMLASAQNHATSPPALVTRAPREASQFDFLVGQFEVVLKPKATSLAQRIHGVRTLQGTWKGWRALEGWGIEDELRVVDASGNPVGLTHVVRVYDPAARRWKGSALDVYRQRFTSSVAQWEGGEMRVSGDGTDAEGKAYRSRIRFHAITPNGFRYEQDRSFDDGKTWTENFLTIEAKRTAAEAPR